MLNPTDSDVQFTFSREPFRAVFPSFCNSLISLEAPRTRSFPVLTTKAGADGGIDGEWDLTGVDGFQPVSVACAGWNVYQFKSLDVLTLGAQKGFSSLCASVRGAVADVLARQVEKKVLAKYVLFTNLRLGIESEAKTANRRTLNAQRKRLRDTILEGAPDHIDVVIIDAGQIAGFFAIHAALRLGWFSPELGRGWDEFRQREQKRSGIDIPLIGRDSELSDLQGWLGSPEVRVIAVSGPNSVGKSRLVIEATQGYAPITFFAEDAHALLRDGVGTYAADDRSVVIVVEDPPSDVASRLAEQAAGCPNPIKLIITLPTPDHVPVVRLGDNSLVKPIQISRLTKEAAKRLIEAVNPKLDNRVRDWIVQQAGGIAGVLIASALLGEEFHRDSESLREQLSRKLRQSLEAKAGKDALPLLQALCPLIYVRTGEDSNELQVLVSKIAPEIQVASILRRLPEFELMGFLRKQGQYVAVVPPMFAAALFRELMESNPQLPGQLMESLDLPGLKRLLERLITLELPESTHLGAFVFGPKGPFGDPERFSRNIEFLDYFARAIPGATARFLRQEIDLIWREVLPTNPGAMRHLLGAINELLDEGTTTSMAFAILAELSKREAVESDNVAAADAFSECFVYWYPRSISYPEREAALTSILMDSNPAIRRLAMKAVVKATNPPDSLGGRTVNARRIGSKPRYGTWQECWDFLLRMVRLRLTLCVGEDISLQPVALEKLPAVISRLGGTLPIKDTMQVVRAITDPYFNGNLDVDPIELHISLRGIRNSYCRSSKKPEQSKWKAEWGETIGELDAMLERLGSGAFAHRLRLALGRSSDYDRVRVMDREFYEYQVPILNLACEACRDPEVMSEASWVVLLDKEAIHRCDFVSYLGENDTEHYHFTALLAAASELTWSNLFGVYLSSAANTNPSWVEATLDDLMDSPTSPKNLLLDAICRIGPTEANRSRLQRLLFDRAVSADEVAASFSWGNWLNDLPIEEVRSIFEFILSEPDHEAAMLDVASLYLHHERPLPRELFDVAKRAILAPIRSYHAGDYELEQVATGLARTDLDEGFQLLLKVTHRLDDLSSISWHTGWNPYEAYGAQDFWQYLRTQNPERAYRILGEWKRMSRWPDLPGHGDKYVIDLEAHHDVLIEIARMNSDASHSFAACLNPKQSGFFKFAYALVELHPHDDRVAAALNLAFIPHSGFGYEFDWLTSALRTVETELQEADLSAVAQRWLETLRDYILSRRSEAGRHFGSPEPNFFD